MNYETAAYLLDKISEIQGVLIQKPPSLPTNFGYVISRIFLYAVILFLGFCFFRYENSEKIKNRISAGILGIILGYILAIFLFLDFIILLYFISLKTLKPKHIMYPMTIMAVMRMDMDIWNLKNKKFTCTSWEFWIANIPIKNANMSDVKNLICICCFSFRNYVYFQS